MVSNRLAIFITLGSILSISYLKMEATGGFEPPNRGFADPRLNLLATSPSPPFPFYAKNKNDAILELRDYAKQVSACLLNDSAFAGQTWFLVI